MCVGGDQFQFEIIILRTLLHCEGIVALDLSFLMLTQFKCVCQPGDEFYVEDCKLKCRCDAPFVTCVAAECPPLHECKLQEGELGCYPTGKFTLNTLLSKVFKQDRNYTVLAGVE